jgi:putative transposase
MKKQSHTRIWIHLMFSTKNCAPLIHSSVKDDIFEHLRAQLLEMGCAPKLITGMPDHVHLLFLYNPTIALCDIVQQLKGNTSHWINDNDLSSFKFVWQRGFTAFSEGEEGLSELIEKLEKQAEYHSLRSYLHEVDELTGEHSLGGGIFSRKEVI